MLSNSKKISMRQAVFLFMTVVFTPSTRLVPAYVSKYAKQAAWLSSIATFVLLVLLIQVWQVLYRKYNDKSLMDIYCDTAGTAAGKVITVAYLLWVVVLTALYIRYFAIRLVGAVYPNVDIRIFIISMLIVIVYTLRFGLTTMARFNEIVFPSLIVVFLLLILMMIPNFRTGFLTPVSYRSILPVLRASIAPTGIVAYFSFMFIFGDRINNKRTSAKRVSSWQYNCASWK